MGGGGMGGGRMGGPGQGGPGMGGGRRGGPPGGGPGGATSGGKERLERLAQRTGGAYFEIGKKLTLGDIYMRIAEQLRNQYSLGFVPQAEARAGYRRLKVDVKRKGLTVQAREGYYGVTS